MSFEFVKQNGELIVVYTPIYGVNEIVNKIRTEQGYNIKNTFWVEQSMLRDVGKFDDDSICFAIGKAVDGYMEINREAAGTKHTFFFSKDINLNPKMFIASKNISVLKKIDQVIDGNVYIGDDEHSDGYSISQSKYKALIETFPNSTELKKYAHKRIATIVKEFVPQSDKYEHEYEDYIDKRENAYLKNGNLNIQNFNRKIRREQFVIALSELKNLLNEAEYKCETVWQLRIQEILKLIYPQYIFSTREITFQGVDGYDKRPDFILVDANGFIDVMEIKKPSARVLTKQSSYRNNYVPVRDFAGAIQQIEKYIFCLNCLNRERDSFFVKLTEELPRGVLPQVVNPQGILIIGRSKDFDEQQTRDFELIKRQYKNIADIMTYDDLISRFERIIDSLSDK